MKRRLRRPFLNVAKIVLIGVLITLIVIVGVFVWDKVSAPKNPIDVVVDNTYEFSLLDYEYYQPENLDFGFIIADITVTSNIPINIGLDVLKTSEGIVLSKTDDYLTQISQANLKPGPHPLSFSLKSGEKSLRTYVFIPVLYPTNDSLTLFSDLLPNSKLEFNLKDESKAGNLNLIQIVEAKNDIQKDLSVKIGLIDAFDKSNFYTLDSKGQYLSVQFGNSTNVYGIEVTIDNTSANLYKINSGTLMTKDGPLGSMNPDIMIQGFENLSKINLTDEKTGFLFFETLSSYDLFADKDVFLNLNFVSGETLEVRGLVK